MSESHKIVATNRRAKRNYDVVESFEAGIVLLGSEVKSVRAGQVQLKDAYGAIRGNELWLEKAHIAPYQFAREGGHDPERPRKLLLKRREIDRLIGKVREQGLTLVPMSVYFVHGLAKVEVALAKGRRDYDKRRKLVERQQQRDMERALRRDR